MTVQCDAQTREWVVTLTDGTVVKRLAVCGMDVTSLTGIPEIPALDLPPIQLTLPLVT